MKHRFLTLFALILTLGLFLTVPAMAAEVAPETSSTENQTEPMPAADKAIENSLVDTNSQPQILQETDLEAPLAQAPEWLQTSSALVGDLQNGCFPPSPPPPSCDCSFCCECNKCWSNGQLVKMPCS